MKEGKGQRKEAKESRPEEGPGEQAKPYLLLHSSLCSLPSGLFPLGSPP